MNYYIEIDEIKVPIKLIEESRAGARISLGRDAVILRIPKPTFFNNSKQKHLDWAKNWLFQIKQKKPDVFDRYHNVKLYQDGQEFRIGGEVFLLNIKPANTEKGAIKLINKVELQITIPQSANYDKQKLIKTLLIKFSQKYFLPKIILKVNHFNQQYFQKKINDVKLKHNKSNWGSCSTGQNLNFSVRLFFAPDDVIDYVVIHELAHLIEMNHSDRFWHIVENIMPDYKKKEQILKVNSVNFDF